MLRNRHVSFILIYLLFTSCSLSTCLDYANNVIRKQEYKFRITTKREENRYNILEGTDKNNIHQQFHLNYQEIYDAAEIGDTLLSTWNNIMSYLLV